MNWLLKYMYPAWPPKRLISLILFILIWEFFLRSNLIKILHNTLNNYGDILNIPSHGIEEFHDLDIDQNNVLTLNEWLPYFYQFYKKKPNKPKSYLRVSQGFISLPNYYKSARWTKISRRSKLRFSTKW